MRKPKQVLVFLYKINEENLYEYCIFFRKKLQFWQGLSGGVEDDESLIETVKREVYEETGVRVNDIYILTGNSEQQIGPIMNIPKKIPVHLAHKGS